MLPIVKSRFASARYVDKKLCNIRPRPATSRSLPRVSTIRGTSTTPAASASSSHIKGRALARDRPARRSQVLINLEHRGACGCEANTGDGAGILDPDAGRFLRKSRRARHRPAAGRRATAPAWSSCRATPSAARELEALVRARSSSRRASASSAGATCRPTTARSARARVAVEPVVRAGLHRARRRDRPRAASVDADAPSSASSTSSASASSTRSTR